MTNNKKILFLTSGEYGRANLALAIAFELIVQGCEVHVASVIADKESGPSLTDRVDDLNNGMYGSLPKGSKPVTLHSVKGESAEQIYLRNRNFEPEGYTHLQQSGVRASLKTIKRHMDFFDYLFHEPNYLKRSTELTSIIQHIRPNVVVVDYLCAEAREAVQTLELRRYVIISHSVSRNILTGGRLGYRIWNFPPDLSGYPFPVPFYMKPVNMYLLLHGMIAMFNTPSFKRILKLYRDSSFKGKLPLLFETYKETVEYVLPSSQEMVFPYSNVPTNITSCGPIQLQFPSLSAQDPDLEQWLKARPTVLMNLGSGYITSEVQAEEIAIGFQTLLQKLPNIQVLWKLAVKPGKDAKAKAVLREYIEIGSVKIVGWLDVAPSSILQSGFVKCSVHSGGPTSYFEAVGSGVPQIALHFWFDAFECTTLIEYLGIGLWGYRRARSKGEFLNSKELSDALLTVMDSSNVKGSKLIAKAKELGQIVKKYDGRKKAAEKIMWLAEVGGYGYKEGYGLASAD